MIIRIVTIGLFLLLVGCANLGIDPRPIQCKHKHLLRFATYNLFCENGHKQNLDNVAKIVNQINPDIMLFQECQCLTVENVRKHFGNQYPYRLVCHYQDSIKEHDDGLAIISKFPIVRNQLYPPVYGWSPGWLFLIKTPRGLIQVFNVHLNPNLVCENNVGLFLEGLWATPAFRLKEICYYNQFLNPKLPIIIAGDFNESDGGRAAKYLRKQHYCDALQHVPYCIKTWRWSFGFITITGRYDRIYTTCDFRLMNCQVVPKGTSDHFPVFADFNR